MNYQYYIVYKITNLLNNKYYIGVHSTDDLNDGYLGSGRQIKEAIKINLESPLIFLLNNDLKPKNK
jgi:hypothetical protein